MLFRAKNADEPEPCGVCVICRLADLIAKGRCALEMAEGEDENALAALEDALEVATKALAAMLGDRDDDLDDYSVGDLVDVIRPWSAPTRH